jgi:hypothetical protein
VKTLPKPKNLKLFGLQSGFRAQNTGKADLSNPLIPVGNGALTQENLNFMIGPTMYMKTKVKLRRGLIAPTMLMKTKELIDFQV